MEGREPEEAVLIVWPLSKTPRAIMKRLHQNPLVEKELDRRRAIARYKTPYFEKHIIERLMREADDMENGTPMSRLKAIEMLGNYIRMKFSENAEKTPQASIPVVGIVNYGDVSFTQMNEISEKFSNETIQAVNRSIKSIQDRTGGEYECNLSDAEITPVHEAEYPSSL